MQRTIEGPDAEWVGLDEACRWLGLGEKLFEAECERYSEWLRPRWFGEGRRKTRRWHWFDVCCLSNVLRNRRETPPEPD